MSGWNPPPPPGGPAPGGYGYGGMPGPGGPGGPYAPPMPPPRKSSSAGLIIGLLVGGFAVVILIVVVVVVVIANSGHSISTPPTAGGMSRNSSAEARLSSQLSSQRSLMRRATGYEISNVQTAVYGTGSSQYLFVGGEGDVDPDTLYTDFRRAMSQQTTSGISSYTIPLANAGGDGKAVCSTLRSRTTTVSYSTAVCAWATGSTFGMVMPVPQTTGSLSLPRSYTYSTVASVMRSMRDDIES
ncbi:hypothetical protein [Spirillospora sp. NPDC029432]|uniref:hypothetical protein n=1 Tax=Spirillospora sp. NPDC029432 TaxID=3154599 RepID=UPI003455C387